MNAALDAVLGTPSRSQDWSLDALGNWNTLTTDGAAQARTHNAQNQLTNVSAAALTFDGNGSTTKDEAGRTLVYDGWNRLYRVIDAAGETFIEYRYDAVQRRIQEVRGGTVIIIGGAEGSFLSASSEPVVTDLYYSTAWQVLEERVGAAVKAQYVWSPVYVDALVLRDRDADGVAGLEQRLYVQQDANWNATALVDAAGNVVERYVEDPYGNVTVLTPAWATLTSTQYAWVYLHQGGRYEAVSALYHFRYRDLSPTLGRPVQRDPIEFAAGDMNLYRNVGNSPTNTTDPFGLQAEASKEQVYQLLVRQCQSVYKAAMEYGSIQNRAQYQKEYEDCLARAKAYRDNPLPIRLPGGGSGGAGRGPAGGSGGGATGCAANGPGGGALSGRPLGVTKVPPPSGWAAIIGVPSDQPSSREPSFLEIFGGTLAHFNPNVAKLPKPVLPPGILAMAGVVAIRPDVPWWGVLGEIGAGPLAAIGTIATIGALAWTNAIDRAMELAKEIARSKEDKTLCVYAPGPWGDCLDTGCYKKTGGQSSAVDNRCYCIAQQPLPSPN